MQGGLWVTPVVSHPGVGCRHVRGSDSERGRGHCIAAFRVLWSCSVTCVTLRILVGSLSLTHSGSWSPYTKGYLKPFSLPLMTLEDRVLLCDPVWPHTCDPAASHMLGVQAFIPCPKVNRWPTGQCGNYTAARADLDLAVCSWLPAFFKDSWGVNIISF